MKIAIIIPIITGSFLVAAYYLNSPLAATQFEDRPIIGVSVGYTVQNSVGQNPFQELDPFIPGELTYEYTEEGFKIIDSK